MNKKVLIGVIAVAGIILLGTWAYIMAQPNGNNGNTSSSTPSTSQQNTPSTDTSNSSSSTDVPAAAAAATITYTDNGFTPAKVVVKKGDVITVKNSSTQDLQFSSADHPSHLLDPELNMNILKPGESGNITISTVGTHGYHNHLDASMTGVIEVTE